MNEQHRAKPRLIDRISAAPHHPEHYWSRTGDYVFAVLIPAIPIVSVLVILVCWEAMIP